MTTITIVASQRALDVLQQVAGSGSLKTIGVVPMPDQGLVRLTIATPSIDAEQSENVDVVSAKERATMLLMDESVDDVLTLLEASMMRVDRLCTSVPEFFPVSFVPSEKPVLVPAAPRFPQQSASAQKLYMAKLPPYICRRR